MSHSHSIDLLRKVVTFIRNGTQLKLQQFTSSVDGNDIIQSAPAGEYIDLTDADARLEFQHGNEDQPNNMFKIIMGENETEIFYVSGYDIFIGNRILNGDVYQIVLSLVNFGHSQIMQLTYHNVNTLAGHGVSHNGTIHPVG